MEEIGYLHVIFLAIISIIFFIGSGICFFCWLSPDNRTEDEFGGVKVIKVGIYWLLASILLFSLGCSGVGWWIYSATRPIRVNMRTEHPIKDVEYPDGSKVQMFSVDGRHYNFTEMFGRVVSENEKEKEGFLIRRVTYCVVYAGISYSCNEDLKKNHFFLTKKELKNE